MLSTERRQDVNCLASFWLEKGFSFCLRLSQRFLGAAQVFNRQSEGMTVITVATEALETASTFLI